MPKKAKHSHRQAQSAVKEKRKANVVATEEADDQHPLLSSQPSITPPSPNYYVKGLSNHGNCCFFNALMQMLASSALLSSAPITQELQKLKEYGPCISNALAGINAIGAKGQPFSVRPLLKLLAQKYSFMDGYTQQDSHEALMLLLDMLDQEIVASNKEKGSPKDAKNSLQQLLEAGFVSTVTCGTCSASSDSQQSCWVMTLPIQATVLDPLATDSSSHPYGSKDKSKEKAGTAKEKSTRVSAKEKKAKLKAEKRAERQKKKGRNSHNSTAAEDECSDEEGADTADADNAEANESLSKDGEEAVTGEMPELCRDASRVLVQSMNLQQSMRERHGWSAPWLPGLWLMPDGSVFHPAQSSLLVSLQMYFEREQGIMWKCPRALETIESDQQRRKERKALQVRIADRGKRERVFEVPGRSHSTARAIPGTEMWGAFTDGSQTWEKFWTCPYDPDTKIVIQVAIISEHSWFENQHPSAIDDYNDPSSSTTLTKACDRLEVTLNKDLGNQYVETHQLAIPPVQCITAEKLRLLSSVAVRHLSMSSEEYHTCVETVEDVICKAQVLLECVHDALTDVGIEGIGKLFSAPISLLRDEEEVWVYRVQGSYISEGDDLSVNTADIRKRFMQVSEHSGDAWVYPAPHSDCNAASSEQDASDKVPDASHKVPDDSDKVPAALLVAVPSGEAAVECEIVNTEASVEVQCDTEAPTPTREKAQSMSRTDSWTEDKFTAMPGRTQFPALSDRNFLLEEIDASSVDEEAEAETAESSDCVDPSTPDSPCPPMFQAAASGTADETAEAVSEGARPSKRLLQVIAARSCAGASPTHCASTPKPSKAEESAEPSDLPPPSQASCRSEPLRVADSPSTCPAPITASDNQGDTEVPRSNVNGSVNGSIDSSVTLPGEAVSERRLSSNDDLARSLSELKIHASEVELCKAEPKGSCNAPRQQCKIHPDRTGILLYPDDGTRTSERHVMLRQLPPLLLCHFSRFQHSMLGTRKVTSHVSFPFQLYAHPDVASRPSNSSQDESCAVRYRLKAVLEHHGRQTSSGHYTSYVWRPTAVVAAAAKRQAAQKGAGGAATTAATFSKSSKARAHPRDIEKPRSRGKGGLQFSSSLKEASSSITEAPSARHAIGSLGNCTGSSLTDASENLFTPGSSLLHPSSVPGSHALQELPCDETGSVEGDLSVADWEELADIPAGLSCNTEPAAMPSGDEAEGAERDSKSGEAACKGGDGEETSQCGEDKKVADDDLLLQNLMAEDEEGDGGVWLKCDDDRVYEVPWQTVASAQAYMLMYEQTLSGR